MGQFSVLHINKYKSLGGIGSHIDRRHIAANVDPLRVHLNEDPIYVFSSAMNLDKSVAKRIEEGYTLSRTIRKDAVKALGVIMGGSHDRMKEIEEDAALFSAWKKANYDFVCQEFGEKNIVRFSLHRDERTPHFHCVFVPITSDGRLSADHFIGTPTKLRAYQDRYASIMKEFGLQRGIHKELTKREHVTSKDYYKTINALAHEVEELTGQIKSSNVFKLDKIREDLSKQITQLKVKAMEQKTQYHYATVGNKTTMDNYSKQSFQERIEQESSLAYSWIKQEIHLADFAVAKLGWTIVKEKSTRRDWVLEHSEHGIIIVPTRPKSLNGHWVYSLPNQKGGGTLIDLLRKEKWDWRAIKNLAYGHITSPIVKLIPKPEKYSVAQHIEDPEQQELLAQKRLEEIRTGPTTGETYLEKRGISREIYQSFPQLKNNSYQAVFGLYTEFDAQVRLCSTINYYFDREDASRKYFQKDLPRGLSQLSSSAETTHIVITESPIDALSYRQLQYDLGDIDGQKQLEHTMYLSTCGNLSVEITKSLEKVFDQAKDKNQEVILAFDNDVPGKKMAIELERLLQEKQCKYRLDFPEIGKDWNESLYMKGRDHAVQDFLARDKLYGFPQIQYEESILAKIGMPQSDCDGIALKAAANSVVFGLHQDIIAGRRLCSTVSYQWDKSGMERQYFQAGLPRGMAIVSPPKAVNHIVVINSPIEAMQHRKSNHQAAHTMYLCTCGSLTNGIKTELLQVFDHARDKHQSISLMGMDDQSSEWLKKILQEKKCAYEAPMDTVPGTVHGLLSKVAHTLGALARLSSGESGEEYDEEEEVKKRKKKGAKIDL